MWSAPAVASHGCIGCHFKSRIPRSFFCVCPLRIFTGTSRGFCTTVAAAQWLLIACCLAPGSHCIPSHEIHAQGSHRQQTQTMGIVYDKPPATNSHIRSTGGSEVCTVTCLTASVWLRRILKGRVESSVSIQHTRLHHHQHTTRYTVVCTCRNFRPAHSHLLDALRNSRCISPAHLLTCAAVSISTLTPGISFCFSSILIRLYTLMYCCVAM